jgi:hypothetical protein
MIKLTMQRKITPAAKAGSIDIVINSGQLYRSLGGHPGSMDACML